MRVKNVWPVGIWMNERKVMPWEEEDIDSELAKYLESKRMVLIIDHKVESKRQKRNGNEPQSTS